MALAGAVPGGRYVLDERIGAGGYREVWHATDTVLLRVVAVKLLPPLPPWVAPGVAELVMRLTAKDPAWQPGGAADVAVRADRLKDGLTAGSPAGLHLSSVPPPVQPLSPARLRRRIALACVSIAAARPGGKPVPTAVPGGKKATAMTAAPARGMAQVTETAMANGHGNGNAQTDSTSG